MKTVLIIAAVLAGLLLIGWVGLKVQPKPFDPFPQQTPSLKTVPIPSGLPKPVEQYYRALYGDQVPVVESAVITARAIMRPVEPIFFPGRLRFSYIAGQGYRHYIELTWFGLPIMKVNERYVDGKSLFQMPWGTEENQPKTNQGANLGLWAESGWFPSIFLTDPRVRWEAVDDGTALLIVPFEQGEETFVVRFDPKTHLTTYFESMRYHAANSTEKTLWLNEAREWGTVNGQKIMKTGAVTWMDDGKPWTIIMVEDIQYNVNVDEYIRAIGP